MTRRRAGKQRADRLNGLPVAADDSAHVRLTQLDPEDRYLSRRNLGEHHLIREFDQLTNDELEKLFHASQAIQTSPFVIPCSIGAKRERSKQAHRQTCSFMVASVSSVAAAYDAECAP